jgi:branched-chain amino acid transport system permease protein
MDWGGVFSQAVTQSIGVYAVVFALAAIGLNVQFGYTGLLNFGQAGFLAVAGYSLAVGVTYFHWSFWVSIAAGLLGAVLLALLLGIPTLRLRADYLAIVTIAASEIIRLTLRSIEYKRYFGGSDGLSDFNQTFKDLNPFRGPLKWGPLDLSVYDLWVAVAGWGLVAFCCLIVWLSMRSPWGRVLRGIREDEDAVRSLGKNVVSYKMQALILGGVLGCLGGFIQALATQSVQPDKFSTDITFYAYAVLILGGAARVFGPVVGSVIFWFILIFVNRGLEEAVRAGSLTIISANQAAIVGQLLLGLSLMFLMIFRPQGILGDKREIALDAR